MSKKILIGVLLAAVIGAVVVMSHRGPEAGPQPSPSATPTASVSIAPTRTVSPTPSPSKTPTPSPSSTLTPTPTATPTPTPTPTPSPTPTQTPTPTPSPTPTPGPQTYNIRIEDFYFNPGTLNVKPGDIVRFTNYDAVDHRPVHDGGDWNTPVLSEGESYNLDTSDLALGTYRYHCDIHGQAMVGTLRIQNY